MKRDRTKRLPWNRLKVGSPVVLSIDAPRDGFPASAVVSGRDEDSIEVAVARWLDAPSIDLDLAADEVTRNRERAALAAVRDAAGRLGALRRVLLVGHPLWDEGEKTPTFAAAPPPGDGPSEALNESQREAVRFASKALDVAVIHGPPGTGKTTTVVEFLRLAAARGETVLACAPSNSAADNLLEKLAAAGPRVVRLGHPARVKRWLQELTLDAQIETHPNQQWIRELTREADRLRQQAERFTRAKPARGHKQDLRAEASRLKGEARRLRRETAADILRNAEVVVATTAGADDEALGALRFDWVVVDEAGQCTEPAVWLPVTRGDRLVLAGDHCQLPPTVLSPAAADQGYGRSMMERLVEEHGAAITRRLEVQYRMHEDIMGFSSEQFYDGALAADPSVAAHTLAGLPGVAIPSDDDGLVTSPLWFIDTAGADLDEEPDPDGSSRFNPGEGAIVLRLVDRLLAAGAPARGVAVIAPYSAQARWLRDRVSDEAVEVDTVDGFQGREKEAIVISLVRSNREREIGFLSDTRRMNVAMTRARRKLIVVGDSATLAAHPFYQSLLDYAAAHGAYRSVWELAE